MPLNNPDYNESPSTSHLTTTSSTQNEQFCLRWNGYHSNLSTTFEQLFHNESLVDVTLVSEGRLLKAHKIVLAANSPYFQTIFSDTPCKHPIVIIKDVKWEELSALVEFMYRGEIHVAQEKIPSLLNLAEMFQICGLTDVHHEAEKKSVTEKDAQPETACGAVEPNHSKNDDVEVSPPKRMMKERDISRKQTFEPLDLPVEWPLEDEIKIEEQPLFKSARKRKQPPGADVVAEHSSADQHLNIPMTITHPTDVIPKSPTLIQPMQTRLLLEEADSFVEQTAEESDRCNQPIGITESITEYSDQSNMLSTHEDELVYSAFKNLPENPTMKCKQLIEKYGSSTTDHINLRSLLDSWNLGNLFNFFIDQHLYVDILKHLSPEMARTLFHHTNIPLGAQIVFYNRWSQWIKESGTTIPPAIENKPQQSNEIRKNHQPTRLGFFNTNLVKSQKPISTINLNAVMRSNKYGSTVISAFNSRKSLDDNLRKLLCDCVLQYCIEFHHELSVGDCASLARQIVDTFPGEVAAYYYLERKNNPPLGRLYSKYRNWKKTLIRKASIKTDSRKKKVQAFTVNDDEEAHICALKSESSNMTFDERMEHWMGCWGTRNNAIRQRGGQSLSEQLLTDWPLYKNPDGHRFIDADFAYLYGCKSDFMDRSETFAELMIDTILPRHMNVMKRNGCEEQFGMLQSKRNYLSKNSILALVLQLTLAILPLSRIKTKNSGTSVGASASEKRIWYTIKESQDAFMAICATEAHYKAVYESKVKNESAVPPYLSIIGSIENLECVMVDFFNVSYKFHSLAEAIDTAIKVYFVFNMPYPEPCQAIWDFINKGFYRIPDLNTVTKPPTILLVTEIEKIMKNQIVEL